MLFLVIELQTALTIHELEYGVMEVALLEVFHLVTADRVDMHHPATVELGEGCVDFRHDCQYLAVGRRIHVDATKPESRHELASFAQADAVLDHAVVSEHIGKADILIAVFLLESGPLLPQRVQNDAQEDQWNENADEHLITPLVSARKPQTGLEPGRSCDTEYGEEPRQKRTGQLCPLY